MERSQMIAQLESHKGEWDICIIGGGATGLGAAVDAASRGYKTILLEQYDFAKGTSSRSTKLVHGGVRYLQQGNIKLVVEALHERGILKRNAPHLVKNQSFVVPNYKWWEGPFYGIGLKIYDWMSGSLGLGPSQFLNKEETLQRAPTLDADGLKGGVLYHDGQFDDARLAISLALTAVDKGGTLINYCAVTGLDKGGGRITGVHARDTINSRDHLVRARVVINATGVFTDAVLRMDDASSEPIITPSQGVHIVLDKEFLPGESAIMVPHTDDGRVLFAVPWHNKIIIGTTDTPIDQPSPEPVAMEDEISFIIQQIGKYLTKIPAVKDIRSVFAGLRPLVKSSGKKTAELSRDHLITISSSGLFTITGGKWTTYRRMAQDVVDMAAEKSGLPESACLTTSLKIHGAQETLDFTAPLYYFGSDDEEIRSLIKADPTLGELIHPRLPYVRAEVVFSVMEEMCMTVDDALARRTRALLLDAQAAIDSAETVASLIAKQRGYDSEWVKKEVEDFNRIAINYLPGNIAASASS